jgi:hypothetical protein
MRTIFELPEIQLERRGHVFSGEELKTVPALYETEDVEAENKVIHIKFFGGPATWYIAELTLKQASPLVSVISGRTKTLSGAI